MRRLLLLLNLFCVTSSECPPGSVRGIGTGCFLLRYDMGTWFEAEENCVREGGHLSSVTNAFLNGFLSDLPNKRYETSYWLGASAGVMSEQWSWTDGKQFVYINWAQGQPSSGTQCLAMNVSSSKWDGSDCQTAKNYICEVSQVTDSVSPTSSPPSPAPMCPSRWTFLNSTRKCYKAVHDKYTMWTEAEQHCVGEGAHLVSVHSPEEQQFISEIAGTGVPMLCWDSGGKQAGGPSACDNGVWIGLSDYKDVGFYEWSDGSAYDYENWKQRPGQHESPSGVAYYADDFTYGPYGPWSRFWQADAATTQMRAFVCNKNPL